MCGQEVPSFQADAVPPVSIMTAHKLSDRWRPSNVIQTLMSVQAFQTDMSVCITLTQADAAETMT